MIEEAIDVAHAASVAPAVRDDNGSAVPSALLSHSTQSPCGLGVLYVVMSLPCDLTVRRIHHSAVHVGEP